MASINMCLFGKTGRRTIPLVSCNAEFGYWVWLSVRSVKVKLGVDSIADIVIIVSNHGGRVCAQGPSPGF